MIRFSRAVTLAALAFAVPFAARAGAPVTHRGVGVIRGIEAGGQVLVIEHHAIPGYMDAMTMPFELGDPRLARGLKVGDPVRFTITQKGEFWPITALEKIRAAKPKGRRKARRAKPSARAPHKAAPMGVSAAARP